MAGLWYILAAAAGLGFIWMALALLDHGRRKDAANEWRNSFDKNKNKVAKLDAEDLKTKDEIGVVVEVRK